MISKERLMLRCEVEERCRLGTSSIYRLMRAGKFPEPIRVGPRAVRWREGEIETFLSERPRATGMEAEATESVIA